MNLFNQHLIAKLLRSTADKIDNGTCGLDDEELREVAERLCLDIKEEHVVTKDDLEHLGKTIIHTKLTIEQVCNHCGISRATLNRWQDSGKFPPFRKEPGGKCYLYLDECDDALDKMKIAE